MPASKITLAGSLAENHRRNARWLWAPWPLHHFPFRIKHAAVRAAVAEIHSHGQFAFYAVCGRVIHGQPPSILGHEPVLGLGTLVVPREAGFLIPSHSANLSD